MELEFTTELMEKVKQAGSTEELLALAKENKVEMSAEKAEELFGRFNKTGELSDDELDNVAGGGCGDDDDAVKCEICGKKMKTIYYDALRAYRCDKCNREIILL